jgi:hypothetical protein
MEYCKHEIMAASCGDCSPRAGAVDLHKRSGASSASAFASEVTNSVYSQGLAFGLVPSGGTAWVFGTGSVLHHRRECSESGSTPDDGILPIPDPTGDLWRSVLEPWALEAPRAVLNVTRKPVSKVCQVCALRPQNT